MEMADHHRQMAMVHKAARDISQCDDIRPVGLFEFQQQRAKELANEEDEEDEKDEKGKEPEPSNK
ncbi:hypothetical protein NW762_004457 [Fusarium torreyae]|uniref:Uncharacterized protein n=1 Tax=Fusarium torreyae TaxID=1237075 RepID=A0A9W8S7M4_9HYPO|nr:hypothetical protein NW762_004457 [Fusarium torreyae]